jgi:hypothetical protein
MLDWIFFQLPPYFATPSRKRLFSSGNHLPVCIVYLFNGESSEEDDVIVTLLSESFSEKRRDVRDVV